MQRYAAMHGLEAENSNGNYVNIGSEIPEYEQLFILNVCSSNNITLVSFEIGLEIARQHCHFAVTRDEPKTVRRNVDPKKDRQGLLKP